MHTIVADFRYAARALRGAPAFTLIAIGSLALGIAAAVTMVSIVNATDFRQLPVPHAERLVALRQVMRATDPYCPQCVRAVDHALLERWTTRLQAFDRLGAASWQMRYVWTDANDD